MVRVMNSAVCFVETYVSNKIKKIPIEDQVRMYNNNLCNDSTLFRFAINSYVENNAYDGYAFDVVAKIRAAFGEDINHGIIITKAKEYIDWAFSMTDTNKLFEEYSTVCDEFFGHESLFDFSNTECYIAEDGLLYVRDINESE